MPKMTSLMICAILLVSMHVSCASRSLSGENIIEDAGREQANAYMKKIQEINSKSPSVISANFVVDGRLENNKKFKTLGRLLYDGGKERMKITFLDSVFRSPLTVMLQDGNVVKFHLPVDKKLYIDDARIIDLKRYVNVKVDFIFIRDLACGRIPLISDYSVKQGMQQQEGKASGEREFYIILENIRLFQTISIKNNVPNKILLLNKQTKEKTEFYLENPFISNNVLYYKSIRFISLQSGERISVTFDSLKMDPKIIADRDFLLSVPRNTEIIRIH